MDGKHRDISLALVLALLAGRHPQHRREAAMLEEDVEEAECQGGRRERQGEPPQRDA